MRIERVVAVPAVAAGYYEDLAALRAAHVPLPQRFTAPPHTSGFRAVCEVAEAVSVGLVLAPTGGAGRGGVAWGDCLARPAPVTGETSEWASPFRAERGLETVRQVVAPALAGRSLDQFRTLAAEVEALAEMVETVRRRPLPEPPDEEGLSRRALLTALARALQAARGEEAAVERAAVERVTVQQRLHPAVRYGVSQALLQAVAWGRGVTMAEVIVDEWGLPRPGAPVPIQARSSHERYYDAEKMIARRVAALPTATVVDVAGEVGPDGSEMTRYLRWLAGRIGTLGKEGYRPIVHLDLRGALGEIVGGQPGQVLGQLYAWELAAQPYPLRIEDPVIGGSREAQVEALRTLREYARFRKMGIELVAGAWAGTSQGIRAFLEAGAADAIHVRLSDLGGVHQAVEAVLACREAGVGVLLDDGSAGTELSARVVVHVALATQPDLVLAGPGLGVDEAVSLVQNEMARALAVMRP
jgi:methylaspartate ammonia-lyase